MKFSAIDVETANPSYSSICQIGLVQYDGQQEVLAKSWLINPREEFDWYHTNLHGIDYPDVMNSPDFMTVLGEVDRLVGDHIVVHHTPFDRTAFRQACDRHRLSIPQWRWFDSAALVRRRWDQFSFGGYGLSNVCSFLGIEFKHHDALQDARACAQIVLHALEGSEFDLTEWRRRLTWAPGTDENGRMRRTGSDGGPLTGQCVVFTGALSQPRRDMADLAACLGAAVEDGVNKRTTILVVGDQDVQKLAGKSKSNKHLKAEKLVAEGQSILIIRESDFIAIGADTDSSRDD